MSISDDLWQAARAGHDFVAFAGVVANITGAPDMSLPMQGLPRAC